MEITIHRAFDLAPDNEVTKNIIEKLGTDRILTSGKCSNVNEGMPMLQALKRNYECQIMAGGGVNVGNATALLELGLDAIHFSIRKAINQNSQMGTTYDVDHDKIKSILDEIKG